MIVELSLGGQVSKMAGWDMVVAPHVESPGQSSGRSESKVGKSDRGIWVVYCRQGKVVVVG